MFSLLWIINHETNFNRLLITGKVSSGLLRRKSKYKRIQIKLLCHWHKKIFLFVFFFLQNKNQINSINLQCYAAESHGVMRECSLKKQNRSSTTIELEYELKVVEPHALVSECQFNVFFFYTNKIFVSIPKFRIVLQQKPLFQTGNSYRIIYHAEMEVCSLFNGSSSALNLLLTYMAPYTNYIAICPYKPVKCTPFYNVLYKILYVFNFSYSKFTMFENFRLTLDLCHLWCHLADI